MILGFPRAKQGLCHTKHGGAGGIILWALLTVFLVLNERAYTHAVFFWESLSEPTGFFSVTLPSSKVVMDRNSVGSHGVWRSAPDKETTNQP